MHRRLAEPRSATRLFIVFAICSLIPVVLLGVVLASAYGRQATQRGLAEGSAQAGLVARTVVEPSLDGRMLSAGLTTAETASLRRVTSQAISAGQIVRLRLRDLDGTVVFSDDGSGFNDVPEDEVTDAAHGEVVTHLTHLNADTNDTGPTGQRVAEVYRPINATGTNHQVGVLEIYLPYAPIAADIDHGLHMLYWDLTGGLAVLYVVLAVISLVVTRRLRQHAATNAHLAEHDPLTGLPNRTLFHRRVTEALASRGAGASAATVAVIDLDRFKEVNDTLGHASGDMVIVEIGRRLAASVRPGDTVGRLGGDEFGVVLCGVSEPAEATTLLDHLKEVIEADVAVYGLPVLAEASIGFATAPTHGQDVDTLLQHAEVAMYQAKAGTGAPVGYDPAHDHYNPANLAVAAQLRHAIADDELVLFYQPKVSVSTGETLAVEALVRWQHPRRGLLGPDHFIPIAEQTGLIAPLTEWVLTRALHQLSEWTGPGEGLAVAVNVSARNLAHDTFATTVFDALTAARVGPERLLIEITETSLLTDPERATVTLRQLAHAGVRISLDDFGRGFTSLGYLSELPLHELKIDKSLVGDMLTDPAHAAIVSSVVGLAHNLGLHVVAEGIEDQPTFTRLADTGCDVAQGYLISRPLPADQLTTWLENRITAAEFS